MSEANDMGVGLPCRMWRVKTQPILAGIDDVFGVMTFLKAMSSNFGKKTSSYDDCIRKCVFSLSFFFKKIEDPVRGVGCGGSC
jgi:hypothetical protein